MIKQKTDGEFIRKRRASLGYSSRQKEEQEGQCVSRKGLSAFMEVKEGDCDFCTKSREVGMDRDEG